MLHSITERVPRNYSPKAVMEVVNRIDGATIKNLVEAGLHRISIDGSMNRGRGEAINRVDNGPVVRIKRIKMDKGISTPKKIRTRKREINK